MKMLLDSFGRAVLYCFHPRVMLFSLLPILLLVVGSWALVYFFWDGAIAWVLQAFDGNGLVNEVLLWLESWGLTRIRSVLGPAVVLFVSIPVMVVVSLLVVAAFMVPLMARLVAERRFPALEKKKGAPGWLGVIWSFGETLLALLLMVLTCPLWLFPPLALVIPPLIWGWLTYRVMAFDVLAEYASTAERRLLMKGHRYPLFAMGVVTGYLGTAPALIWASGAMWIAMAPIVLPIAIWLYTLTFAFAGLWFAHYALCALHQLRQASAGSSDGQVLDVQAREINTHVSGV
jgi:Etoposide-induced protein 2.4 (EI24)